MHHVITQYPLGYVTSTPDDDKLAEILKIKAKGQPSVIIDPQDLKDFPLDKLLTLHNTVKGKIKGGKPLSRFDSMEQGISRTFEAMTFAADLLHRTKKKKETNVEEPKGKDSPKPEKSGQLIKRMLLAGNTTQEILDANAEAFPKSNAKASSVAWYLNFLRKEGLMEPAKKAEKPSKEENAA